MVQTVMMRSVSPQFGKLDESERRTEEYDTLVRVMMLHTHHTHAHTTHMHTLYIHIYSTYTGMHTNSHTHTHIQAHTHVYALAPRRIMCNPGVCCLCRPCDTCPTCSTPSVLEGQFTPWSSSDTRGTHTHTGTCTLGHDMHARTHTHTQRERHTLGHSLLASSVTVSTVSHIVCVSTVCGWVGFYLCDRCDGNKVYYVHSFLPAGILG